MVTTREIRRLESAARRGELDAMQRLGDLYAEGRRGRDGKVQVRRNTRRAESLLREAARAGHVPSQLSLGHLYAQRRDLTRARFWYRRVLPDAALGGSAAASLAAAELASRNDARALSWLELSRDKGDGDAAVDCAYMRYYGIGVRKREPAAAKGLSSRIHTARTTPFAREEAHYLEAVAMIDRGKPSDRDKLLALLVFASRDGDYREAERLLALLREGKRPRVVCRCRRGRPVLWSTRSPCEIHVRRG